MNVSQVGTIDRERLTHLVGKLSARRLADVLTGIGLVFGLELPTLGLP